jgi:pSer/pThr/pTyr-binding forkhead associated (FHA) protein
MTRRIGAKVAEPEVAQASQVQIQVQGAAEPIPEPDTAPTVRRTVPAVPEPEPESAQSPAEETGPTAESTRATVLAKIRYSDNAGPAEYTMTRPHITIGRGGRSYWVDLRLDSPPDISREHCRIRTDGSQFTIEDLSTYGTSVNGTPVEKDRPVTLPQKAKINLANVVDLEWESL